MPHVVERTVFKFAELSERAKERARERWRDGGQHDEWWEYTYEDAVAVAECLGIEIDQDAGKRGGPRIYFSGFWSQGDGASWLGRYTYKADAIAAVQAHAPQDEELLRIAQALTVLQMTSFLECGRRLEARVTSNDSRYCHSNTMDVKVTYIDEEDGVSPPNDQDRELTQLLRDFADWIYKQLEAEDEYLNSDECIDPQLAEREFIEDGTII